MLNMRNTSFMFLLYGTMIWHYKCTLIYIYIHTLTHTCNYKPKSPIYIEKLIKVKKINYNTVSERSYKHKFQSHILKFINFKYTNAFS